MDRAALDAAVCEFALWAHTNATRLRQLAEHVRADRIERADVAELALSLAALEMRLAHVLVAAQYAGREAPGVEPDGPR